MKNLNPLHAADFYKTGHVFQYPEGTQFVYSNLTARSDSHANMSPLYDGKTVFFGLQSFIRSFLIEAWNAEFFNKPKAEVIAAYKRRMDTSLGKDSVDVSHIEALHDLGYLPICIRALPEGSRVDIRVPYLTIFNTLNEFFWLTNYIETVMSAELWKRITVATIAYEYRRVMNHFARLTGETLDFAAWQIHDFSMRGMSGLHDAYNCSPGHLLSNYGTDTIPAIDHLEDYYLADADKELIGGSVPATEHSVMCMGGEGDEIGTFRRLIKDIYPSGIVSIVSDTWDFWKVITEYAVELKADILSRAPNALGQAKVVFRPDSGDPVKIICGDPESVEGSNERLGAVEILWNTFGGTTNDLGYKTLDSHVGLIYGDSITLERQWEILTNLMNKGFSSSNVVFGVGSYTYQYVTRDTFGMAIKATYGIVNDDARMLSKNPKTDNGTKKSARGLLAVKKQGSSFVLVDGINSSFELLDVTSNLLRPVFYNGKPENLQSLADIRALLDANNA